MKQALFNPFIKYAGTKALAFGLLFISISWLFAALCNARFDGIVDLHFYDKVSWLQPMLDQFIGLLIMVLVFYLIALVLGSKPRLIDLAGTFAYSRLAFLLAPLLNISGLISNLTNQLKTIDPSHPVLPFSNDQLILLMLLSLATLALVVWLVALYFKAWKTCSNLKGNKLVFSFIAGLLIVEVITVFLTRNFIA